MASIWQCKFLLPQALNIYNIVISFKYWNKFKPNTDYKTYIVNIVLVDEK